MGNILKLVCTSDGSHTILVPELNEHYHSVNGAVLESSVVYIANGFSSCDKNPVRIFEVGFGTGLNALLTMAESIKVNRSVSYTAIDRYPLPLETANELNHWQFAGEKGREYFRSLHDAGWGNKVEINENFSLYKIEADLITYELSGSYDLIYFDAFAPSKQPEMWEEGIIKKISSITSTGGIFVTYSSRGELKRLLKKNGFSVTLLPGPPGKREVIRAIKN